MVDPRLSDRRSSHPLLGSSASSRPALPAGSWIRRSSCNYPARKSGLWKAGLLLALQGLPRTSHIVLCLSRVSNFLGYYDVVDVEISLDQQSGLIDRSSILADRNGLILRIHFDNHDLLVRTLGYAYLLQSGRRQ